MTESLKFHCLGCRKDFVLEYQTAKNGVVCPLCGCAKPASEMSGLWVASILKIALDVDDVKYKEKITITK